MPESELTKLLVWPGYRVCRHEINEKDKKLRLWVRRKRGNRELICSGGGRKLDHAHVTSEREVQDLPTMEVRTTVIVEIYRVCCPGCGVKTEKVPQLPSKAPFSKRFEDAVGAACEIGPRQTGGLPASNVRAIDKRYLLVSVRTPMQYIASLPADHAKTIARVTAASVRQKP